MKMLNRLLLRFGYVLAPAPPSSKMLREHANVSETHHPSRGGRTVAWLRGMADLVDSGKAV
jgi:hypothetical protein